MGTLLRLNLALPSWNPARVLLGAIISTLLAFGIVGVPVVLNRNTGQAIVKTSVVFSHTVSILDRASLQIVVQNGARLSQLGYKSQDNGEFETHFEEVL